MVISDLEDFQIQYRYTLRTVTNRRYSSAQEPPILIFLQMILILSSRLLSYHGETPMISSS